MREKWKSILIGFFIGCCVIIVMNLMVKMDDKVGELQEDVYVEEQVLPALEESASGEDGNAEAAEEEAITIDADNAKQLENITGTDMIQISESTYAPLVFVEELYLYQYIEYGIRKYNEDRNSQERYSVDIEKDMLPYDTEFTTKGNENHYKIDLAKEIIPELSNNLYHFRLEGESGKIIYMSIDTFNMKIYVYGEEYFVENELMDNMD